MGLHDITFQDVIEKNGLFRAGEIAFISGDRNWEFGRYSKEVKGLARGLVSLDLEKGDVIGILSSNCYEYFLIYGAAACIGATVLPINWRLKAEEIQLICEICSPKVLFVEKNYRDEAKWVADRAPFLKTILTVNNESADFRPLQSILSENEDFEPADVSQQDPFIIIPTAAVGGRPKGAVLTHQNLMAACFQNMALMEIQTDDLHLNALPLFHIMGIEIALTVFYAGGRNVLMKRFDARKAAGLIEKEHVTIIPTVAPMLSSIMDASDASGHDLQSLRVVAGLTDHPDTVRRCQEKTGAKFWVGYGQSETTGYITLSPFDERPGSSGKEALMARIRLVDDYDREVENGRPGEVVVRGPLVFQKYWDLEAETAQVFRDGWHHTGDICRLDEDGYIWYVKRKAEKELIKPGGENVYPSEVEKALLKHPDVTEACVFGVPDKEWGEAVKAVCALKEGSSISNEQALIEFVGSQIARYKKPNHLIILDVLPKTEEGDVDRERVKTEHGGA